MIDKVINLVRSVGDFQLKHFRDIGRQSVNMKAAKETVSFVDVESEKMLFEGLQEIEPKAGFYGEESGKQGDQKYVWIVDPLDGTTNYLNGLDHFSISIALVENSNVKIGIVYKPYTKEWIGAVKGEGVFCDGDVVENVQREITKEEALFVTGFPYRSEDLSTPFFKCAEEVLRIGRGIRRTGSAALDLAYLGVGRYGGFWESDLQPYDVAAAILIMEENGVSVTNHKGEPFDMFSDRVMVAAQPRVQEALLSSVRSNYTSYLKK